MRTSLLVTTYDWPEALELTFCSLARQVTLPDEVIVADDGSGPATAALVRDWAARLPVPVRHVWQEDDGFRLARSRNRGIAAARGEYVVIVDGDLTLHPQFIADHRRAARPGCFMQGGRLYTDARAGRQMLEQGRLDFGCLSRGVRPRHRALRNRLLSWLLLQRVHTGQAKIQGCNQAYWRDDLLRVNGFDERITGWGREDNELAVRLYNAGVVRRNLRFAALTVHIHHPGRMPVGPNRNEPQLHASIAARRSRCELGIDQHLAGAAGD